MPAEEHPPGATGLLAEDTKKFFLKIALDEVIEYNSVPECDFHAMHYAASEDMWQTPCRLYAKTHRRVIFEEECQCIHKLSSYADVALGMAQLV